MTTELGTQPSYLPFPDAILATQLAERIPSQNGAPVASQAYRLRSFAPYTWSEASIAAPKEPTEWLSSVEREMSEVDELAKSDEIPRVEDSTRAEALRIVAALGPQAIVPVVYPDEHALVIHFKAPDAPASVSIEIRNDGRGDCYSYIDGRTKTVHFGTSADIPDESVRQLLNSLSCPR